MKRLFLALAAVSAVGGAQAANQYIFGFSGSTDGNGLTVNGSTTLDFVDQGWYFQNGTHNPGNPNYIVGHCDTCSLSGEYRNWFVVDISSLSGPVTSLSMTLYSYDVTLTSGNYYLNDFGGSVDALMGGTGGVAAFNDLGSGTNYGFRFYQVSESSQFHTIALNGGALADLNAAVRRGDDYFAIGGSFLAGDTPKPPVPEPSTYALMLLGLAGIGCAARRRRA